MSLLVEPSRTRQVSWSDPRAAALAGSDLSGLDYLNGIIEGRIPEPPVIALLGIRMDYVEGGLVRMSLPIGEHLYNPLGSVHGGMIATLLDSVMGCVVHSTLPAGRAYTTLEIKVNYLRAVTDVTGEVVGEGRVVHAGRQSAVAGADLKDRSGRLYATASTTCLIFDRRVPA